MRAVATRILDWLWGLAIEHLFAITPPRDRPFDEEEK